MTATEHHLARKLKQDIAGDLSRIEFLERLDRSTLMRGELEKSFVADLLENPRPLTAEQRAEIDKLVVRYIVPLNTHAKPLEVA